MFNFLAVDMIKCLKKRPVLLYFFSVYLEMSNQSDLFLRHIFKRFKVENYLSIDAAVSRKVFRYFKNRLTEQMFQLHFYSLDFYDTLSIVSIIL